MSSTSTNNGHREVRRDIRPLEVEMDALQPMAVHSSTRRQHPLDQLWMLIKLYIESYPKVATVVAFSLIGCLMFFLATSMQAPVTRNRLSHDYSGIDLNYNFKASQIDHWCLFGGDTHCRCDDFSEPVSREEFKAWLPTHEANKDRIKRGINYDVVFLGDETTEGWNGKHLNMPIPNESRRIQKYWNETFTKDGGGDFEGLALGIGGDSAPNLLWRLKHGEAPVTLTPNVWWLLAGTNDLGRGGCSEEATILGILRTAEELHYSHPDSVIVIQGILPRSSRPDGSLSGSFKSSIFGGNRGSKANSVERAQKKFLLWPSIQNINKELEEFCAKHEHLVYFDASSFFLGRMGNAHFSGNSDQIVTELMPDYKKISYEGYKVMGAAILSELQRIIYEDDETNDVEPGSKIR